MKRRFSVAALCLFSASAAWSLDAESQRLADRYLSILAANPAQETAFDRLWKIYAGAGETPALIESARTQFATEPRLSVRILLRANLRSEAETRLTEAVATGSLPATEMLAGLREESGDLAAAAALLEKAAADHPEPGLFLRLGTLWQKAGDSGKARAAWERAVTLSPHDLALRDKLAEAAAQSGDLDAAIVHLRVIAENGSPTERFAAWEKISRDYESAGKMKEAVAAQQALLDLMGPGHWKLASARQRLITLHERAGTLDVLEKQWQADAAARPRDPEPCLRLAEICEFQGDAAQRLLWLRQASELLPKDFALAGKVAALELSEGKFAEAGAIYDRMLARQPDSADIAFLRAEVFTLAGNEKEAERRIESFVAAHRADPNLAARAEEFYQRLRLAVPLERMLAEKFSARKNDEQAALALARFYLDHARFEEAVAGLRRFDDSALSVSDRAAVAFRFSEILLNGGLPQPAEAFARRALDLEPSNSQYAINLVELLSSLDQVKAAEEILVKFCAVSPGNLPREDVDRRLFLMLQGRKDGWPLGTGNEAMQKMFTSLNELARSQGGENDWLRLARWKRWIGPGPDVLREAVEKLPDSTLLQEALAVEMAESGNTVGAIAAYERLREMAPERTLEIQRKVGHLQLDSGAFDEALRIFGAIRDEQPRDWKSSADLALAEQMAGNWFEALEIWKKAYALAPADARRGLRQPFLNATIRLQMFGQGLDFYEEASASEKDDSARTLLLQEAAAYAFDHRVTGDWRSRLQRRASAQPAADHWKTGLALLLAAEGRGEDSRRMLAALPRRGDDSAEDFEKLLKTAEDAGDWKEAARLAARLMALRSTPDASLAMRQAGFLERAGLMKEAEQAWASVAARHGRNSEALSAAAEFFGRIDDETRWEQFYRAAAALGGSDPRVSLRLGLLALERGDKSLALADFQAVLKGTRPDLALYKNCLPLPALLQARPSSPARGAAGQPIFQGKVPSEEEVEGCRLLAIQQVGQLLVNSPGKAKWLAEFNTEIERIWALYFSGETALAFPEMEKLLAREDKDSPREQVFAALLIDLGESRRLGQWASARPADSEKRWSDVLAALSVMLEKGWKPSADFFDQLLASAPALQRWHACRILAQQNQMRLAAQIGGKIPDLFPATQAATAWLILANWQVALAEPAEAIHCLDRALAAAVPETSYTNPFFEALRARWLLTPAAERPAFTENITARLSGSYQAMAAALLASLNGEHSKAAEQIELAFQTPLSGENASWREFVNEGGARLEEWRLPRLARDLYRNDRNQDLALQAMRGENFRRLSETMLILNQLGSARSDEIPYFLNEWLARGASDEELMQAFLRLQQLGQTESAAAVYTRLCERVPHNEIVAGAILNALTQPHLRKAGFAYFEKLLADHYASTRRAMMQNAGLRLAQVLEQEGQVERSLALLAQLRRDDAVNRTLLLQHVDAMSRAGRHREALTELESSAAFVSSMPGFALPAARLYTGLGREREAVAVLEREIQNTASPDRLIAARQLRDLSILMGDQVRQDAAEAVLISLGQVLAGTSAPTEVDWEKLQQGLDKPGLSGEERFRAGMTFLTANAALPEPLFQRELERLRKLSLRVPRLRPEFYVLRKVLAGQRGTLPRLEEELRKEWDGGRGASFPGEILVQMLFEQQRWDDAVAFMDGYLTDAHFNADAWEVIGRRFLEAGRPAEARRVFSESIKRSGSDARRRILLASALEKSGLSAEAREQIAPVEQIAALDRPRSLELAGYYLAVDQPVLASRWLELAPNDVRTAGYRAAAAGALARAGDLAAAREELSKALKFPETVSATLLADFYAGPGQLESVKENEFNLPPRQWREFQLEVLQRLVTAHATEAVWARLASEPGLLDDERGRQVLKVLEKSDWKRAVQIWNASESLLWDTRCAAAAFYLRKFRDDPEAALKDLTRAHELHPGSFTIAEAYVKELLKADKAPAARKVLQEVINAYATIEDRRAAREMLVSLQASPVLPKEG